ncbi:MAG: GntR family transcriptional regulator, partial [Thermodesulfobacteriota bacterium]
YMNTVLPIYYQIKQTIKDWVVNREYLPGEKIPSENELAYKFKVSRLTIRQALSHLIQEGFLITRRGDGTFVTEDLNLINRYNFEFRGLLDDFFFAQISEVKAKSVEINRILVPKVIREKLDIEAEENEVIQVKRVRYIRDRLLTYSINYLPLEIGKKIKEKDLYERSMLQILEQDLKIPFSEAVQTIEASFANPEVAEKLTIPSGAPILFIERIMYKKNKKPVEIFQSYYRGDMFKFIVRYKNVKNKSGSKWVHRFK